MAITIFPRELLFGRWYRSDIDVQGNETIEYAQMSANGHFEFTFSQLNQAGNVIEDITEFGYWGLVGDIHFTITKDELIDDTVYAADLNNEDNYHAYRVLVLNHSVFQYRHCVTNEEYIMRRVVDDLGHC